MGRGKSWEIQLEMWHRRYAASRNCIIFKANPGAKVVGGRLVWSSKGPPDYFGALPISGRMVCFDAKDTKAKRMYFSKLPAHQVNALRRVTWSGGVAFWALRLAGQPCILRFDDYEAYLEAGRTHVQVTDCQAMLDDGWLSVILNELEEESSDGR